MTYGIQSTGFVNKPLETIIEEIEDEERANIDSQLNTSASSPIGNLNGIIGARLRELWEKAQEVYASQYPDSASGVNLDLLGALTGATRLAASKSTLSVRLNIDAGITVPAGSIVAVDLGGGAADTVNQFETTAAVTNGGGAAADFDITMEGTDTGALAASAGAMVIVTPITGWNTATALADAVQGRDIETDAEFRVRRAASLRSIGGSTPEAIRGDLLAVSGVTEAFILENETSTEPDANGLDAHSFEAVVLGGADSEVAQAIWDNKPAGIATNGTTTESITDSAGTAHDVKFTRPTLTPIYLEVDVTVNPNLFPDDGAAQIAAYIETQAADDTVGFTIGDDVVISKVSAWACAAVAGVEDVTAVRVGIAASPTQTTNWAIGVRELAQIADDPADRLVVTVS